MRIVCKFCHTTTDTFGELDLKVPNIGCVAILFLCESCLQETLNAIEVVAQSKDPQYQLLR
jgi:hypothetical protein